MQIDPESPDQLGGKARFLRRMEGLVRVPRFFTVAFRPKEELSKSDHFALLDAFDNLSAPSVAVRSSASQEDSPHAAYPGVFETKLDVVRDQLFDAVKSVLDSAEKW